ncbi:MFS transporter [Amycolatopsis sp. WGS_07]|uniref:MFS transporter n=1 Tax=Amycolatopsis sp. WGS_07 TaxID=3076764 RepID=UPI003872BAA2
MHPSTTGRTDGAALLARLEGLPFTKLHKRIVAIVATAYLVDAADVAILTFVLAPISSEFRLTALQSGSVASLAFVGMALGSAGAGWLSDRFGRRPIFTMSMLLWGLASLLTAFAFNYESLLACRFLTGIGMGAELPCAVALISEYLPARRRGAYLGSAQILVVLSFLIAGGATLLLDWRLAFVLMFVLSMFAFVVRRGVPESVRWQVARGRIDDARATLARFEALAPAGTPAATVPLKAPVSRGPLRDLFTGAQRRRTATAWAMWFFQLLAQYGINIWIAKLLVDHGASIAKSIGTTMFMLAWGIPGTLVACYLLERLGRRPVYAGSAVLTSAAALWYGLASSSTWALVAGCVMNVFLAAMTAGINAYTPELFSTGARATGAGTASAAGRIGSVVGPLAVPAVLAAWGFTGTFLVLSLCFLAAAAVVLLFGRETRGEVLENLAE